MSINLSMFGESWEDSLTHGTVVYVKKPHYDSTPTFEVIRLGWASRGDLNLHLGVKVTSRMNLARNRWASLLHYILSVPTPHM